MLIRKAEVWGHGLADVRIEDGRIAELAAPGTLRSGNVVDAKGCALLPGLHDHHVHLFGLAAKAASVECGPPAVTDEGGLARALQAAGGTGWLRGVGYHESVMGLPDARTLDRLLPHRPLRIQQRTGRMWLLNTLALETLLAHAKPPPGLERGGAGFSGRLFDEDLWLRQALGSEPPDLSGISRELAAWGVTGVTDMSVGNDGATARHFARQGRSGALLQHCTLAGRLELGDAAPDGWSLGPAKLHLHEAALPPFEEACRFLRDAHASGRPVAVHCVTEVELVFTLALFDEAGAITGDRIEHASVTSTEHARRMADLGLSACVQPHFVRERGDRYLLDVEERHQRDLYRLSSLRDAGIPLAGGSDAPFASADPWEAMRAAVDRRTREGRLIGKGEALSPEAALALYLADPADLARQRQIVPGASADLVLLNRPWSAARQRLTSSDVRATLIAGRLVHDSIDQAPG